MSNNNTYKSTNSTSTNSSHDHNEGAQDSTTLSSGDVKVGISSDMAQSMITQVDRNGQTVKNESRNTYKINGTGKVNTSSSKDPVNTVTPVRTRTVFEWMFCCGPKSQKSSSGASNGSLNSSNGQIGLVHTNSLRSLPARIPEMEKTPKRHMGKKCLALDLDETLVHSSFQPVENASFIISVVIEGIVHNVYVMKRPGCDEFMKRLSEHYELLIYTASLSKYADPLLDILDPDNLVSKRLFREHCVFYDGHYVKDLSLLNRDISQTIIVDNSPMSYIFHPENAIDCSSFFDDPADVELWQIADFLINIRSSEDVRPFCRHWREWCRNNPSSVPGAANGSHGKHL